MRQTWIWLGVFGFSITASAQPLPSVPAQSGGPAAAPGGATAAPSFGYPGPATYPGTATYPAPPTYLPAPSRDRSGTEISFLYAASVLYGVGLGIWLDGEIGVEDPALFMIAPAVLGLAAPAGVYALDHPPLRRGLPAAIAAGAIIGAGEGVAISSVQFVTADEEDAWGFRGLSRATALGATLGAAGGVALGYAQRPSPRSSVLLTSSVFWGGAIGSMFGYGTSDAGVGYGRSNDRAAVGGLIGYNVGLAAAAALSTTYIPTSLTLQWMWGGAGIGFAASLPVYLFYLEEDGPPAKRGLVFSATATVLGIGAGALFTASSSEESSLTSRPAFARITSVGPMSGAGELGLGIAGELQ